MSRYKQQFTAIGPNGEEVTSSWQNISELVSLDGYKFKKNHSREFARAQAEAMGHPAPAGFDREVPLGDINADDSEDDSRSVAPVQKQSAPVAAESATPVAPTAPVNTTITLEDMDIDELREVAANLDMTVDRRVGTKGLIAQIREKQGQS